MNKPRKTDPAKASQRMLYHATLEEHLAKIRKQGLQPNFDRDTNFDGYDVDGKLFVAKSLEGAEFYSETLREMDEDAKAFILRFPATGIRLRQDPYGNLDDYFTTSSVPAGNIEALKDGQWIPLAELRLPRRRKPQAPKAAPVFTVGRFSVFAEKSDWGLTRKWVSKDGPFTTYRMTSDGRPKNADNHDNLIGHVTVDEETGEITHTSEYGVKEHKAQAEFRELIEKVQSLHVRNEDEADFTTSAPGLR